MTENRFSQQPGQADSARPAPGCQRLLLSFPVSSPTQFVLHSPRTSQHVLLQLARPNRDLRSIHRGGLLCLEGVLICSRSSPFLFPAPQHSGAGRILTMASPVLELRRRHQT